MEGDERLGPAPEASGRDWPLRPWLLAGGLALAGLAIHFASHDHQHDAGWMALSALLFFGPLAAAFSLERERWREVAVFAGLVGLVMAGIAWREVHANDHYAGTEYAFASGVIAIVLSVPLFQAGFRKTRFATPYRDTHFFVWTDVVSGGGALAFTGLTFAMTSVLAKLFGLLRIDFLQHLLEQEWFDWMLAGTAFGAALGVLRNQLKVLGTLQMVVLLVLSLLAVPLAVALVVFLGAMVVSGPEVLWEATRSATPVLLACAAGSFVLVNAVVRDDDQGASRSLVLRIAALVLALGILPLTVFAAVSLGTRVAAYGLSPERLWGLIAIAVACAYGLAYLVAVLLGRRRAWRDKLRRANFYMAAGTCALALLLALPVLDFGAVSAANQLARLHAGKAKAQDFDYDALKWDFGDAGRRALATLVKSSNADIAGLAKEAEARTERPWRYFGEVDDSDKRVGNLRFQFDDPLSRKKVEEFVRKDAGSCEKLCVAANMGATKDGKDWIALVEGSNVEYLTPDKSGALASSYAVGAPTEPPFPAKVTVGNAKYRVPGKPGQSVTTSVPKVEVRKYEGRQIYVDGKPVGQPFQ